MLRLCHIRWDPQSFYKKKTWQNQSRELPFHHGQEPKGESKVTPLGVYLSQCSYTEQHTISPLTSLTPESTLSQPPSSPVRVSETASPGMISPSLPQKWFLPSPSSGTFPSQKKCIVKSVWFLGKCGKILEISFSVLGFALISPGKWFMGSSS